MLKVRLILISSRSRFPTHETFSCTPLWLHLAAGAAAGLVILVMSVTGAVLAFKPQILNQVDRKVRVVEPAATPRLPLSQILAAAQAVRPGCPRRRWCSIAIRRLPQRSVRARRDAVREPLHRRRPRRRNGRRAAVLPHDGGPASLAELAGENRDTGRALTGASNLAFLALAVSGLFLWWPHNWLPQHVNAILFFRRTTTARARDFNWHNVVGFWCAPLLIVLTATGAVMSYPWANRLLYEMAGSPLPAPRGPRVRQIHAGRRIDGGRALTSIGSGPTPNSNCRPGRPSPCGYRTGRARTCRLQ